MNNRWRWSLLVLGLGLGSLSLAQDVTPANPGLPPVEPGAFSAASAQYYELQPEFVLNYGQDGRVRFLRLVVTLVVADRAGVDAVTIHSAGLRHQVVMQVTAATREDLTDISRRAELRERIKVAMQEYLMRETGFNYVEDVLFSNLILQ